MIQMIKIYVLKMNMINKRSNNNKYKRINKLKYNNNKKSGE